MAQPAHAPAPPAPPTTARSRGPYIDPDRLDTHFDRYPHPRELLRYGGLPGVEYCLVAGINIGKFERSGWSQIRDMPSISIGRCDSVVVMGRGEPIAGADPTSSRRTWYYDTYIRDNSGVQPGNGEPHLHGHTSDETVAAVAGHQERGRPVKAKAETSAAPAKETTDGSE